MGGGCEESERTKKGGLRLSRNAKWWWGVHGTQVGEKIKRYQVKTIRALGSGRKRGARVKETDTARTVEEGRLKPSEKRAEGTIERMRGIGAAVSLSGPYNKWGGYSNTWPRDIRRAKSGRGQKTPARISVKTEDVGGGTPKG